MSRIDIKTQVAYIAGRFDRRGEFEPLMQELAELGITCTSRWITEEPDIKHAPLGEETKFREMWALNDMADVMKADTIIAISENLTEESDDVLRRVTGPNYNDLYVPSYWARGGRHVEFGIAVAMGKRIVVVGPRENIFHWLPQVEQYDDWDHYINFERGLR